MRDPGNEVAWSTSRRDEELESCPPWMDVDVYLYTAHITSCFMAVYNAIEWERTSACEGASGCRYQSIQDLTHPPNPCMKCEMKLDHNTGNYVSYSFREVCGFFNVPCQPYDTEDAGDGSTVYSPYPRRLECLTICVHNYKGSTFSSVVLRPWVLVRSGARTFNLPHSRLALYQLS